MSLPATPPASPSPDPVEPPPHHEPSGPAPTRRALRAVAIVRWALLGLVTALALATVWRFWGPGRGEPGAHVARAAPRYYCPMHPEIRSPDPGHCPICHMNLEPIPQERLDQAPSSSPSSSSSSSPGAGELAGVTGVTVSQEKQRAIGLATSPVEHATLGGQLRVPGVVSAPETGLAQVRVRAPGFVERVAVRQTGVRVSRGQPLAYIYSPEIYRAQEEYLAATRWSGAAKGEGAGAAAGAELAAAAGRGLELLGLGPAELEELTRTGRPIRAVAVRAPAAGYVTRFNAVLGSRAEPEMVLYEIADLSTVWVVASVHERDLRALRVGMPARFTAIGEGEPLAGRVELIEPLLEEATRTTRVRVVVPNRAGRFRPGQSGEVLLELPSSSGLFVPRDAVIHTGEQEYVYVAPSAERFEPRRVRIGLSRQGQIQVLAGVSEGERVVTRGSFMLDSESRLQASLAAAPAAAGEAAGGGAADQGPSCEADFDRERLADKYLQCRACERQHAGMGRMAADCKRAIARPWR